MLARSENVLQPAFDAIDREFGDGGHARQLKKRVRRLFRSEGLGSDEVAARYAGRAAELCGLLLEDAVLEVERTHARELEAFRMASTLTGRPARLPMLVTQEIRLFLRWLRLKRGGVVFQVIVGYLAEKVQQ